MLKWLLWIYWLLPIFYLLPLNVCNCMWLYFGFRAQPKHRWPTLSTVSKCITSRHFDFSEVILKKHYTKSFHTILQETSSSHTLTLDQDQSMMVGVCTAGRNTGCTMTFQKFGLIHRSIIHGLTFPTWLCVTVRVLRGSQCWKGHSQQWFWFYWRFGNLKTADIWKYHHIA